MAQGDGNPGMNKLAQALNDQMRKYHDDIVGDLTIDFGKISNKGKLKLNSFPNAIPKGQYWVCESADISNGDKVIAVWVQEEVCVIDKIKSS